MNLTKLDENTTLVHNNPSNSKVYTKKYSKYIPNESSAPSPVRAILPSREPVNNLDTKTYNDPFTRIATSFYMTLTNKSDSEKEHRIIIKDGAVAYSISSIGKSSKQMARENSEAIKAFSTYMEAEIGSEKFLEIQNDYGFDLAKMLKKGEPLHPKYVYYFNVGINNLEMKDYSNFKAKVVKFSKRISKETLKDFFTKNREIFTYREMKGLLTHFGEDAKVSDVQDALKLLQHPKPSKEGLKLWMNVVSTKNEDFEKLFTGRKYERSVGGSYRGGVSRNYFQPWMDQQELLQLYPEIKGMSDKSYTQMNTQEKKQLDYMFNEKLIKVIVKKHLIRLSGKDWRVGELFPSPYRDEKGDTVWYTVKQGVDSGNGKMWFILSPASEEYAKDFPEIRTYRDTSPNPYAQSGASTIVRDFPITSSAGYLYSDSTAKQDKEYFKSFTLPTFLANLAAAQKTTQIGAKKTLLYLSVENLLSDKEVKLSKSDREKLNKVLVTILKFKVNTDPSEIKEIIALISSYGDKEDQKTYSDYMAGNFNKRPLHVVGNSLGGFDAQYDLVKQLADKSRVPLVPIDLYCHSAIRIEKKDNDRFMNFVKRESLTFKLLGAEFKTRYIAEDKDPVPKIGNEHTYLGDGSSELIDRDFEVFTLKEPKKREEGVHGISVESPKLREKVTIDTKLSDLDTFNEKHNASYLETGRKVAGVFISVLRAILYLVRNIIGRRGVGREHGFSTVDVKLNDDFSNSVKVHKYFDGHWRE